MSWKSLVSAGLLCVLASTALAVPQLNVSSGGLDAQGNWIWNVAITPSATGTPLAAELGFRETVTGSQLLTAIKNAAVWDNDNPGSDIFGTNTDGDWEVHTDVDTGTGVNMKPVGVQTNAATDEVFSALGSIDLTSGSAVQYVTITNTGPTNARATTSIQVLGAYSGNGRIAEITGTTATNYSNFAGTATRTVQGGDINLSGTTNDQDFAVFGGNWQDAVTNGWAGGDFNRDGIVNDQDFAYFGANWQGTGGAVNTPLTVNGVAGGASLGGGSAVPEPASVALAALALLGSLGLTLRRRQK